MTAGSGSNAVAGGPARHIPVLARLAIDWLAVKPDGLYVDATFGGGGYTRAILQTAGVRVIGIDRDQTAIAQGAPLVEQAAGRLQIVEDRFSNLDAILESIPNGADRVDGIVLDLGVSSMQLEEAVARIFVSARRTARHAHEQSRAEAPPMSWRAPRNASSPRSSRDWEKKSTPAPSRERSSERGEGRT